MASLYDAMDVLVLAASAAINATGNALYGGTLPPSQTLKGWPVAEDLTELLGQQQYLVSIYDHGGKRDQKYINFNQQWVIAAPVVNLSAIVDLETGSVAFVGTVPATGAPPLNIHTFVGAPAVDVFYQTVPTDTPTTISTKITNLINAEGLSFVTATSTGSGFDVTGSPNLAVNIGSSGTYGQEVDRHRRTFQLVVWTPVYDMRLAVGEAILGGVGTENNQWYQLPDGTYMQMRYESDHIVDESQSDYSLYEHHMFFNIWLPRIQTLTATQVEGFQVTQIIAGTTLPVVAGS